jgi:hypothetical protein
MSTIEAKLAEKRKDAFRIFSTMLQEIKHDYQHIPESYREETLEMIRKLQKIKRIEDYSDAFGCDLRDIIRQEVIITELTILLREKRVDRHENHQASEEYKARLKI